MGDLETEIHRLAGREFNIGSPKQLGEVLFDEMGLRARQEGQDRRLCHRRRRAGGRWPPQGHALPQQVLDWRQIAKLKSTYADALVEQINPQTGRVHTSLRAGRHRRPAGSPRPIPTCRTSRSAPRRAARSAAPSSPSRGMCCCRSTIRRSSCASPPHVAEIEPLKQAFRDGADIHALTASPGVRRAGRGHGPDGPPPRQGDQFRHHLRHQPASAWRSSSASRRARPRLHRGLFRALSRHPRLHGADQAEGAPGQGYVTTLFGRRCHMPGINDSNPARAQLHGAGGDQRAAAGHAPPTSSSGR